MVPCRHPPCRPILARAACAVLGIAAAGAVAPLRAQQREVDARPLTVVASSTDSLAVLGRWTVRSGLPQQSVTELAVDRDGFLWGATFGGLIRFDGDRIEPFGLDRLRLLGNNLVTAVAPARAGGVWIGVQDGIVARVRDGVTVGRLPVIPFAERAVEALAEGEDGTIWAWAGYRLLRYRAGHWRRVLERVGTGMEITLPILPIGGGDTVLVGSGRGPLRVVGESVAQLVPGDTVLRGAWRMARDRRGRLWVASRNGVYLVPAPWGASPPQRVLGHRVRALAPDGDGGVWAATIDTVWQLRAPPGAAPTSTMVSREPGRYISLATTRDGVLVAGTMGDGLFTFVPRLMRAARLRRGTEPLDAAAVVADGDALVVSLLCKGLGLVDTSFARARFLRIAPAVPSRGGCVQALARDPATGALWVAKDSLLVHHAASGAVHPVAPLMVRALAPLAADTAIALTADGALVRVSADGAAVPVAGWRTRGPIVSLAGARDGALWLGARGVVTRFAAGRATTWDTTQGVPVGPVRAVHVDAAGRVWAGSYGGGLAVLPPGARRWRRLSLADPTVITIAEDRAGTLWLSQNRGLTVLRRDAVARWLADPQAASPAEPLAGQPDATEGNNGAPATATLVDGRLVFVTVEGLVLADPSRLPSPAPPPRLVVSELRTTRDTLGVADTVRLPLRERTLDVRVAAPAFRNASELRFRYRVEGRDRRWLDLGARRQFLLTELPAGTHPLRVQLTGPDGTTSESPPLVLVVPPYWYETPWAALTAFGVLAMLLGVYMRQRTGVLAARNAALQAQLDARRMAAETTERHRRELAQVGRVAVAGEMTAALMHELGQPLTAIVNNAEVARRLVRARRATEATEVAAIEEALDDIATQGARAAQVVTSLRRFLRRGVGPSERIAVAELVAEVSALVRQEYADARVALEARVDAVTPPVRGERVLLQQVLVNLLTNACDAVRGRGDARVLLRARAAGRGGVRISVVDNGPGVAPPLRETVFDAFVSGKESGMGMGLAIARRIVEGHGGTVALGAARDGGAVFSVRLPGPEERLHD